MWSIVDRDENFEIEICDEQRGVRMNFYVREDERTGSDEIALVGASVMKSNGKNELFIWNFTDEDHQGIQFAANALGVQNNYKRP